MGDREVSEELAIAMVGKESVEALEERVFTVGEVVEYWEGAFVRGARLGSGQPAFQGESLNFVCGRVCLKMEVFITM